MTSKGSFETQVNEHAHPPILVDITEFQTSELKLTKIMISTIGNTFGPCLYIDFTHFKMNETVLYIKWIPAILEFTQIFNFPCVV